jgi:hypothetical protein
MGPSTSPALPSCSKRKSLSDSAKDQTHSDQTPSVSGQTASSSSSSQEELSHQSAGDIGPALPPGGLEALRAQGTSQAGVNAQDMLNDLAVSKMYSISLSFARICKQKGAGSDLVHLRMMAAMFSSFV